MKEKAFITANRLIWLIVLSATIIIPLSIVHVYRSAKIEMVDSNASISSYDKYSDSTWVDVEVTFNREVSSAYIEVVFYDENGNRLATKNERFSGWDKTVSASCSVDGKVGGYEISEIFSVTRYMDTLPLIIIGLICGVIAFGFFIASLLLSYKKYTYNGNDICVYAGWYHHYIKVNGEKYDEHNTLVSYTALYMSCTLGDGAEVQTTISLMNRISLKINGRLQTPVK